ncbi:hypothetical protein SeHA_C2641 [Salmonella enterica subsp. enterica serovar Heidelberg str. SL476]|uniref:Uncharacterized protein n=1 Tax=Salmonella heidelberg (strain SL476) TaxID=454169 RepID=A0A6C6ZLW4_SALHS|nr:hypothetical protein SeHA_C2641 [Salmonella enterica subsp. enterica serovar Heidelberg str. SL476]
MFFYKRYRQPAPVLGMHGEAGTEKNEKNFSFFQFYYP